MSICRESSDLAQKAKKFFNVQGTRGARMCYLLDRERFVPRSSSLFLFPRRDQNDQIRGAEGPIAV